MIPLPVLLLLLLLLQESQNTFAFTIPSKSLVNSYRSSSSSSSSSRGVSTVPEKNEEAANGNPDDMDMDEPKSLFDIDSTVNNDASLFQVKDMSSFQEVENDNDEDDDDSIMDMNIIDVEYDLEYDDDDLYSTNIEDMDTSIYTPESMGQSTHEDFDSFTRDTDDILEEREDRLYVNELGEESVREKCILIGVENLSAKRKERMSLQSNNPEEWEVYFDLDQSMDEMKELITTGGLELAGVITQRLNEVNPKTYIGTGKVKEAQELLEEVDSCTVVFDGELSPGQQKALENAFNKEVIQNDFLGSERAVSFIFGYFTLLFMSNPFIVFGIETSRTI